MDIDTIRRKLDSVPWYHRFEILPGIFTPGELPIDPNKTLNHFGIPADLTAKEVLEIGTLDGPIAFAAEARGATVTALDIQDPSRTGFNIAKEILNSNVNYIRGSVYDAKSLLSQAFDYIFFLGVFYHLKHPIRAFEEISKLLTASGTLIFEGECLRFYSEDEAGLRIEDECVERLARSNIPLALFYADSYKRDASNWFIPNFACLKGWLAATGFEITTHYFLETRNGALPLQRVGGTARVVGGVRDEHRIQQR